ncbi:MAG: hypothetical protein KDF65_04715 [Anaerolineae bacterium]|nr:hypothetical protein [Anaerolineae bacterium]
MNQTVTDYLETNHIDSVLKLNILLFLIHHPDFRGSGPELAECSYVGNTPCFEKNLDDLCSVGVVERVEQRYQLSRQPDVTWSLHALAQTFEDPLTRQEILAHLDHHTVWSI